MSPASAPVPIVVVKCFEPKVEFESVAKFVFPVLDDASMIFQVWLVFQNGSGLFGSSPDRRLKSRVTFDFPPRATLPPTTWSKSTAPSCQTILEPAAKLRPPLWNVNLPTA